MKSKGRSEAHVGGNGREKQQKTCMHCGWQNHRSEECKYKNLTCHRCGNKCDLSRICKSSRVNYVPNHPSDYSIFDSMTNKFNYSVLSVASTYGSEGYYQYLW